MMPHIAQNVAQNVDQHGDQNGDQNVVELILVANHDVWARVLMAAINNISNNILSPVSH